MTGDYRMSHQAPDKESGRPLHFYDGGEPDDLVAVYRAAPPGTEALSQGDWISLNPDYARQHSRAKDPARNMLVYVAEVQKQHVYWDENSPDEHGYQGPPVRCPDVLEEDGQVTPWQDYHDAHPHGLGGWLGGAVRLPGDVHDLVHDEFETEPDRASALLDKAREQDSLAAGAWADHPLDAREEAEALAAAALAFPGAGGRITAFTVHRGDDGSARDIEVHPYQAGDEDAPRRYQLIDLDGWNFDHPVLKRLPPTSGLQGRRGARGR